MRSPQTPRVVPVLISRRSVLIVLLVAAIAAVVIFFRPRLVAWTFGPPRLTVDPPELTVGPQEGGERRQVVTFELANSGGEPLRIESVSRSCGCTVVDSIAGTVLAARETMPLRVNIQLPSTGTRKDVTIRLHTDAAETPEVVLPLTLIGPELTTPIVSRAPDIVYLSVSEQTGAVTGEFEVWAVEDAGGAPWITGIRASDPQYMPQLQRVQDQETVYDGKQERLYQWRVQAPHVEEPGDVSRGYFEFEVNRTPAERLPRIGYEVLSRAAIELIPDHLSVVLSGSLEPVERRVLLRAAEGGPWPIAVESNAAWLTAALEDASADSPIRILRVQVFPERLPDPAESAEGALTLHTASDTGTSLTLPIAVLAKP